MEYVDVYDENDNYLGYSVTRDEAHEKNLWHRHVSCWIMNEKGEILLQQRALTKKNNPGMWAKTGGHVDSGETTEEAVKREVFEEIGLKVEDDKLINMDIYKSRYSKQHYYSYGYIMFTNNKEEDFVLQEEEVSKVKYFSIEDIVKYKKEKDENFTFYKWDEESFYDQMSKLRKYRDKIKNNVENKD